MSATRPPKNESELSLNRAVQPATPTTIDGTAEADALKGTKGPNTINALGGDDGVTGGGGNDTINLGAGNDVFYARRGDDNDSITGGDGVDTYDLSAPRLGKAGVTVNLATGTATGERTGTDTLAGIENVVGSKGADTITGNGEANRLDGGRGADLISGGAGNDTLIGGAGGDTLTGGANRDTFLFEPGSSKLFQQDVITDFTFGNTGDTIDLRPALLNFNGTMAQAVAQGLVQFKAASGGGVSVEVTGDTGSLYFVISNVDIVTVTQQTFLDSFLV